MPVLKVKELINNRVEAIRAYHASTGIKRAQLDISGGIDSACMLGLLVRAIGADQITAVYTGIHSSESSRKLAQSVADAFGVALIQLEATHVFDALIQSMGSALRDAGFDGDAIDEACRRDPMILGSIRSCLRAPIGRGFNRMTAGGLRHGTGNECEDRWLRFYQKGGDGEVDSNPINMLSKGEVFQLAKALGVPQTIIDAKPTPDLWANGDVHNDEDEIAAYLGLSFEGHSWYSYINGQGDYSHVGLSERISRFLDLPLLELPHGEGQVEDLLFAETLADDDLNALVEKASTSLVFQGVESDLIAKLLPKVRRVEAITRHKENPNCPGLGRRQDLVKLGILGDELPR